MFKKCKNCYNEFPVKNNRQMFCSPCGVKNQKEYMRRYNNIYAANNRLKYRQYTLDWQKRNREKANAKSNRWYHKHKDKAWNEILDKFGRRCNCCGLTDVWALTLDHINNDGNTHRKRIKTTGGHATLRILQDVVNEGMPLEKYQILCWSCNMGKNQNKGKCPHKS